MFCLIYYFFRKSQISHKIKQKKQKNLFLVNFPTRNRQFSAKNIARSTSNLDNFSPINPLKFLFFFLIIYAQIFSGINFASISFFPAAIPNFIIPKSKSDHLAVLKSTQHSLCQAGRMDTILFVHTFNHSLASRLIVSVYLMLTRIYHTIVWYSFTGIV